MIRNILKIQGLFDSLTSGRIVNQAPTLMPPDIFKEKPVILLRMSKEWQKYYVIYAEACERIENTENKNDLRWLKASYSAHQSLQETINSKPEECWTNQEIEGLIRNAKEIANSHFSPDQIDEMDLTIQDSFWDDLAKEINETENLTLNSFFSANPFGIGIFADEEGWCVAFTDRKTSEGMKYFSYLQLSEHDEGYNDIASLKIQILHEED